MRYKKGLSLIVTSLLIILLVLIAIGIIWVVVRNVVDRGTDQISITTKCLEIDIKITAVTNTSMIDYDVTLTRTGTGEEIDGLKIVFHNATESSSVVDVPGNILLLETVTKTNLAGEVTNANKIEVTPYLKDDSGKENYCQTIEYNF
ncbi:hypothetical protein KAJ87_00920 [Candidatus Pacearchaeota archaeon]|nr:hypothetical protein [Candidatus Pacearchaeota archaeon]